MSDKGKKQDGDKKLGIYVCQCGKNIADVVDVDALVEYSKGLPNVTVSKTYKFMCSKNGQELIAADIKSGKVDHVVVAACSPLMHEATFRKVLDENNLNEFYFEQANIREHVSWVNMADHEGALEIAKDHVKMAAVKSIEDKPLERLTMPVTQEALVVGGGITGMFAALDLANKYKVHLVERSSTIGGHMAQLDKTFPTMDCSACIITPKMVEVGAHPNINIMSYSEIESVDLTVGNFEVKVREKAKMIDYDICNGCGACGAICPITTANEFDYNMAYRGAAYMPFPQAVPSKYVIDIDSCIECKLCVTACEVGAVDFSQKDKITDIKVGSVILATGVDVFDPAPLSQYGYSRFKNVIMGLEMERLLSSTGPTLGKVVRPSDHKKPKTIAFVQCVGSRDFRDGGHKYCSRVCCMYAMKQARQFKEKYPESEVYIIYIDIRAFGKGYEEFYEIAGREYDINFIRGRVGNVYEKHDGTLLIRGSDTLLNEKFAMDVDMLILSAGLEARHDAGEVGRQFGVQLTDDGFFMEAHPKLRPVDSLSDGVFMAGTCQAPKDIPDAVSSGRAAASAADNFMAKGEVEIEPYYSHVIESLCSGCKSCVSMCPYDAITIDPILGKSSINIIKCKGCGTCMMTCPTGAIEQHHFTNAQIRGEVAALFSEDE